MYVGSLQNSRFFFSKSVKKSVKRAVRVLRARSARASHARRVPVGLVRRDSPQVSLSLSGLGLCFQLRSRPFVWLLAHCVLEYAKIRTVLQSSMWVVFLIFVPWYTPRFCGLLQFPGVTRTKSFQQLTIFLCHKYPQVSLLVDWSRYACLALVARSGLSERLKTKRWTRELCNDLTKHKFQLLSTTLKYALT